MKKFLLITFVLVLMLGCTANVKMSSYPGIGVSDISNPGAQYCYHESYYGQVKVLLNLPEKGTYVTIGSIIVSQIAQGSFFTVSDADQVKAARIKACKWNADAIVILSSDADIGLTSGFFGGTIGTKSKQNRIVAIKFINQVKESRIIKRGYLGIYCRNASGGMGILVEDVLKGSPAEISGIQKNDLIVALNGNNISDFERFRERISSQSPGDTITITIIRSKNRLEFKVQLGERKIE